MSVTVNGTQIQYFYDANGNRIRKYDGTTNTYYIIGAGGQMQAVKTVEDTAVNATYNILVPQAGSSTGQDNIGQVRIDTGSYNRYYYLKDHLGSVRVTVDASGNVAGYNDFYPFGETMPGRSMVSSADPRYGYIGKEGDVETRYDWFGPGRYYDPWRAGFNTADLHAKLYAWSSPYVYAGDNPIGFVDRTGMDSTDSQRQTTTNQQQTVNLAQPRVLSITLQSSRVDVSSISNGFACKTVLPIAATLSDVPAALDYATGAADILRQTLPTTSALGEFSSALFKTVSPYGLELAGIQSAMAASDYTKANVSFGMTTYNVVSPLAAYGIGELAGSYAIGSEAGLAFYEAGRLYDYLSNNVPIWLNDLNQGFTSPRSPFAP